MKKKFQTRKHNYVLWLKTYMSSVYIYKLLCDIVKNDIMALRSADTY